MFIKKKYLIILLLVVSLFLLNACTNNKDTIDKPEMKKVINNNPEAMNNDSLYLTDVMAAMNVRLPRTSINKIYDWLQIEGETNGWKEIDAKTAQSRADKGYPTIAIWKGNNGELGHSQIVRPENKNYRMRQYTYKGKEYWDVIVTQAGQVNFKIGYSTRGFTKEQLTNVLYYTHD